MSNRYPGNSSALELAASVHGMSGIGRNECIIPHCPEIDKKQIRTSMVLRTSKLLAWGRSSSALAMLLNNALTEFLDERQRL